MDVIKRDNPADFSAFAKGTPDATLAANFRSAKKVFDIADALAVFTNTNMVTNETIFGTDRNGNLRRPITHPETPYGSPMLESMTYTENDYCYRSATGVKQCVDHYIYARLLPMYCYPFVDMECVKSQAGVLIPNIIAAGTDAIRLFIPKLTVDIESVENGVLKGKVTHKTDDEYPIEIKYNGEVILSIQDRSGKETDAIAVDAKEGLFEQDGIKPDKDEKIVAKIEFGGITVESSEFMNMASIFGIYQGTYTLQMNEANMLEMYNDISMNASMDAEMRQTILGMNQHKVQMDRENIAWIKGGAQGGPIVKFEIGRAKDNASYWETNGSDYYVYNLSNTAFIPKFLTPLKDKSNAGTTLVCRSNGFTCTVVSGEGTYTINATFKGNNLEGNWNKSYKGKVLQSATFTARKIVEM
jgi:hypothetical protein